MQVRRPYAGRSSSTYAGNGEPSGESGSAGGARHAARKRSVSSLASKACQTAPADSSRSYLLAHRCTPYVTDLLTLDLARVPLLDELTAISPAAVQAALDRLDPTKELRALWLEMNKPVSACDAPFLRACYLSLPVDLTHVRPRRVASLLVRPSRPRAQALRVHLAFVVDLRSDPDRRAGHVEEEPGVAPPRPPRRAGAFLPLSRRLLLAPACRIFLTR